MRQRQTIGTGELVVRALGVTPSAGARTAQPSGTRNLIAQARRGLYLVPRRLPPGGKWTPSEFLALTAPLLRIRTADTRSAVPAAFYRCGWSSQIPNRLYAYNNRLSGERKIGSVAMTLIKLDDSRAIGETEVAKVPEAIQVIYSSRSRPAGGCRARLVAVQHPAPQAYD